MQQKKCQGNHSAQDFTQKTPGLGTLGGTGRVTITADGLSCPTPDPIRRPRRKSLRATIPLKTSLANSRARNCWVVRVMYLTADGSRCRNPDLIRRPRRKSFRATIPFETSLENLPGEKLLGSIRVM